MLAQDIYLDRSFEYKKAEVVVIEWEIISKDDSPSHSFVSGDSTCRTSQHLASKGRQHFNRTNKSRWRYP